MTSSTPASDPQWAAVDNYTLSHLHPPSRPNQECLAHALANSRENDLPDISSYATFGKFLALHCQMANVQEVLEVGTLGAYASIWIATLNPKIRITTLEVDPKHAEVARQNLRNANVLDRVDLLVGPALETLPKLLDEIKRGERPPFGLTFIDADKPNNWVYFDYAVKMSHTRACICVDNVVMEGKVISDDPQIRSRMQGARTVIEEAGRDARVDAVVMQTVNGKIYDGFLWAIVK